MTTTNGHAGTPTTQEQLTEARARVDLLRTQEQLAVLESRAKRRQTSESMWGGGVDWYAGYMNLFDRFQGEGGLFRNPISLASDRRYGDHWPFWRSWQEHAYLRGAARVLCTTNSLAIGVVNGLTSYVVGGKGFTWEVEPIGKLCPPGLVEAIQERLDQFCEMNRWSERERESFARSRVDGEYGLRHFLQTDGSTLVRVVEPEHIVEPPDRPREEGSYGVLTEKDDVEQVNGYWVTPTGVPGDGEEVGTDEMVFVTVNTPATVKRGLSDFSFDTYDWIRLAGRLIENMGTGSAAQAAVTEIRQWVQATASQVDGFLSETSDYQGRDPWTGRNVPTRHPQGGEVRDVPKGMEYIDPPYSQGISGHAEVAGLLTRTVGARWKAPQWFIDSDASNNNYASSLTAESPFVKECESWQHFYVPRFRDSLRIALKNYAEAGLIRANGRTWTWEEIDRLVRIKGTPPTVETRDKDREASTNRTYIEAGVVSRQQVAAEQGIDHDQTIKDNLAWQKHFAPPEEAPQDAIPASAQPDPSEQARAVAGGDLRTTVGGLQAIASLQQSFYDGKIPREAAMANVRLLFGFSPEEADQLFPAIVPTRLAPDAPSGQNGQPAAPPGGLPMPEHRRARLELVLLEEKYTGSYTDAAGHRRCYQDGRQVPCQPEPGGGEKPPGQDAAPAPRGPVRAPTRPKAPVPERLKQARRVTSVAHRRRALHGIKNEGQLAEAIGGFNLPDSEPADVVRIEVAGKTITDPHLVQRALRIRADTVRRYLDPATPEDQRAELGQHLENERVDFFEVKTLLTSPHDAVRMSAKALARKKRWQDRYQAKFHLVGFDDRRGGKHSGNRVYVTPPEEGLQQTHRLASLRPVALDQVVSTVRG